MKDTIREAISLCGPLAGLLLLWPQVACDAFWR